MKKNNYIRLIIILLTGTSLSLFFSGCTTVAVASPTKVLYVTQEPGKWHKYGPQMAIFKEIATRAGWEVTYWTGAYKDQVKRLETPDFGKGYDAIVYNFCFAAEQNTNACSNTINQTKKNGVPAMHIHCAMHSFKATYRHGVNRELMKDGVKQTKASHNPKLVQEWEKNHPGEDFPAWGDFTGIASIKHGPRKPIVVTAIKKDHPAVARLGEGYTTKNTELYNNFYILDEVVPLAKGEQKINEDKTDTAVVMWECPQGKSKVIGLSLGHDVDDWKFDEFQNMIIDGINYLAENPSN